MMRLGHGYLVAVGLTGGAFAVGLALRDFLSTTPSPLFTLTIVVTAWLAGFGPAVLGIVLSILALDFLFFEPVYSYGINLMDLPWLIVFTTVALLGSWLAVGQRRALAERRELLVREQQARQLAEDANRTKDEFLAILGHELRNPLGAVVSALTVLDRDSASEEQRRAMLQILRRQVRQLQRLVEDLVDVARLATGKISLVTHAVDVGELVASTTAAFRAAEGHHHRVDCTVLSVTVLADPQRLEQMLWNLLANAAKFTPDGGRIQVMVERTASEAVLRVRDTGQGIGADLLPRIFDVFVQGQRGLDRARGGLGIGLTLVRRIVELHGGDVAVASGGVGLGSEFTIRLPALAGAPAIR